MSPKKSPKAVVTSATDEQQLSRRAAERWTLKEAAAELSKQSSAVISPDEWLAILKKLVPAELLQSHDGEVLADDVNALLDADPGWRGSSPRLPSARQENIRRVDWFDGSGSMHAAVWFGMEAVSPKDAASILSQIKPRHKRADPDNVTNEENGPDDFSLLLQVFLDVERSHPGCRTLLEWLKIAKVRGCKYHPWIDEYLEAREKLGSPVGSIKVKPGDAPKVAAGGISKGPYERGDMSPKTPLTAEEIKRRRQIRLEAAVNPRGSGYSGPREVYRESQEPIDWRLWSNLADVALWEACLLSLNINPTGAEQRSNDWTGYGDTSRLKRSAFPDDGAVKEYEMRLRLLESNRGNDKHFSVPVRKTAERMERVFLPEFAAWALHIGFQDLPAELVALAAKPHAAPELEAVVAVVVPVPQTVAGQSEPEGLKEAPAKRQGWRDVSWPYIQRVFAAGQYSTAKLFYKALLDSAGKDDSPFDKGTGSNLGSLFVREIAKPLALKTVENAWTDIRASGKTG